MTHSTDQISIADSPLMELARMPSQPPSRSPEVVVLDGAFHLQFADDVTLPMMKGATPLRDLGPGWRFESLCAAFAPVLLFELAHESGGRATWFFDTAPSFVSHSVENLPAAPRKVLLHKAGMLLNDLLAPVLGHEPRAGMADRSLFFGISETARREIGAACCGALLPAPDSVLAADLPEALLVRPDGAARSTLTIARDHMLAALAEDFQARLIAALRDGWLSWRSPVNGSVQQSSGCLCFDHFSFAYRLQDSRSGLVCFLLVTGHNSRLVGLYFPTEGLIVARDQECRNAIGSSFPDLPAMIVDHVCKFGETLLPYLSRGGEKRVAGSMRENHLGHQIWNELSGLDALVTSLPPAQLPAVLPLGGSANAFFGPLDAVFPELAGMVRTDLRTERDIVEYAHANDLSLARFTREFVSGGLRDRIVGRARHSEEFRAAEAVCRRAGGPIVLVGLRVENRTAIDLPGFLARLVKAVAAAVPGALIVLDGQNSNDPDSGQQATASFMSQVAARSPLLVELEVCEQVAAAAAADGIAVEVASGRTLAASIAWAELADCVIAFWGAGLAKYRWIANKPTLALTNRHNLFYRRDLHIYSLPRFMADPTPVVFTDPLSISDDPDAPQLIRIAQPSFANFKVDESIFMAEVRAFLAQFAPGAGGASS